MLPTKRYPCYAPPIPDYHTSASHHRLPPTRCKTVRSDSSERVARRVAPPRDAVFVRDFVRASDRRPTVLSDSEVSHGASTPETAACLFRPAASARCLLAALPAFTVHVAASALWQRCIACAAACLTPRQCLNRLWFASTTYALQNRTLALVRPRGAACSTAWALQNLARASTEPRAKLRCTEAAPDACRSIALSER